MSYYMRGDYYRGDYYRGDFWSGLAGAVKGAIGGLVTGGPIGAVIGGISGAIGGSRGGSSIQPTSNLPTIIAPPPGPSITLPGGTTISPTAILPGGAPFIQTAMTQVGGACPKGYRLNKSTYFLLNGTRVPAGTRCVRYRSMNPLNVRALRKGVRRAEGFVRIARRTVTATTLPSGRRKKFKTRKRS